MPRFAHDLRVAHPERNDVVQEVFVVLLGKLSAFQFVFKLGRDAIFLSNAQRQKDASLVELAKIQRLMPLNRKHVFLRGLASLDSFDLDADAQRFTYYHAPFDLELGKYSELGTFNTFDIPEMKHLPLPDVQLIEAGVKCALSPDGELLAFMGSGIPLVDGTRSKDSYGDYHKIQICSVATGKLIKTLETGSVEEMIWSPDSASLIVSTSKTLNEEPDMDRTWTDYLAKQALEYYDTDKDGKLSIEEAKPSRKIFLVDKNKDGFVDRDEIAEARAYMYRRGRTRPPTFNELETRIYNVSSGDHILLQANATSDESSENVELCFQRDKYYQFAKPVIYENQIVLPLFVASTFQNGSRPNSTRQNRVDHNDMLGFFDIQTGKLAEVVELKCEFEGLQFEITKDLIATRASSDKRARRPESFIVFDRKKNNEGYLPINHNSHSPIPLADRLERAQKTSSQMKKGTPHLSPKHPLVAVSGSKRLEIWKLDSDNRSFGLIKTIRVSNKITSLTWHPTKPIVAWIAAGIVHSYNAGSGEVDSFDAVRAAQRIAAAADGWLIFSFKRVNLLDDNLAVRKTYLSTKRFENYESAGKFDQCISADGTISNKALEANLRVVQLRENRIETRGVEVLTAGSSGQ